MGGWGWQNAYVCLQGGWVGMAKCLRNYDQKDQIDLGEFWVLNKYKVYLLMTNNSIRKKKSQSQFSPSNKI